jgi:hypothetical protein
MRILLTRNVKKSVNVSVSAVFWKGKRGNVVIENANVKERGSEKNEIKKNEGRGHVQDQGLSPSLGKNFLSTFL